jgi:hypothetical protein
MKAWLRAILWVLLSRPIIRAVDWTDAEAKQFEAFYNSSCGKKLFELLRQTVASVTFNAVYRNSVNANAHARGMQDVLALIHRLRNSPPGEEIRDADEDIEPLPSQRGAIDGRRFGWSGGNSAIG